MTSPEEFYKQIERANFPTKDTREGVFTPPIAPMNDSKIDGRNIGVVSIPPQIKGIENPVSDPTGGRETMKPVTFPTTLCKYQDSCAQSIGQIRNIGPNVTSGKINQSGNGGQQGMRLGVRD